MRTVDDYKNMLVNLLPTGFIWPVVSKIINLTELLAVIAGELFRVESRKDDLVNELIPDGPNELLSRWESILRLPESCIVTVQTTPQRIAAILAKLKLLAVVRGSLSRQSYIDLAERLGYTITITDLSANHWQVNGVTANIVYFRLGISGLGDRFQVSDNDLLECAINQAKPAHTLVTFNYT